jgi:hypothetical protein
MTDSQVVLNRLQAWARAVARKLSGIQLYVFGSLIYRDGNQFLRNSSDVDLVLILPEDLVDAASRTIWLAEFLKEKIAVESELCRLLLRERIDIDKAICSVVAITKLEVRADIHKDGSSAVFSENQFLNLLTGERSQGLPGAGQRPIHERLVLGPLRYTQKIRNIYLAVSANGTPAMAQYEGDDPAPKDAMRNAAMVNRLLITGDAESGTEYDTQKGLDLLSYHLFLRREQSQLWEGVHDKLSRRRGARGEKSPLTTTDQLLIAESVFDLAAEAASEPVNGMTRGYEVTLPSVAAYHLSKLYLQEPILDSMQIATMEQISVDLVRRGWRLDDKLEKGQGCTNPAFNRDLVTKPPFIRLRLLQERWAAYEHYSEDLRIFTLAKAREISGDFFNDKKIRLASDFIGNGAVAIQQTDYLSSLMTDQLAWYRVRSKKLSGDGTATPERVLWDGMTPFIQDEAVAPTSRLKGLGEASISNQLGASTLAFSSDGHLMIVYQSDKNLQSANFLAPSGSGSLDWADMAASNAPDLLSLVRYGAERELREECALDDDGSGRQRISSKVMVTGFVRMLHRAGKPEFFCLGRISAPSYEIFQRRPERYVECVLCADVECVSWRVSRPKDEILRVCRAYLEKRFSDSVIRIPLSYPLEHALMLLIEACQDNDAAAFLDDFMLDEFE